MKKNVTFFSLLFLHLTSFSQAKFEKGYFVNKAKVRVECLIKNADWHYNPQKFEYQLLNNPKTQIGTITDILEFGIDNKAKYIKATVKMDKSSDVITDLSPSGQPVFSEQTIFLKPLLEGESNLYEYEEASFKRFFFNTKDKPIEQLIYKQFLRPNGDIGTNAQYRQQLTIAVNCAKTPEQLRVKLEYKKSSLISYFQLYNQCFDKKSITLTETRAKFKFHVSALVGVNNTSLEFIDYRPWQIYNEQLGRKSFARVGAELELVLPFNNNKWSLFLAPMVHKYQENKANAAASTSYKALEYAFGFRYSLFLNNDFKLFLSPTVILDRPLQGFIYIGRNGNTYRELSFNSSLGLGGGVSYKKIALEMRFYSKRDILGPTYGTNLYLQEMNLLLKYKLW
jgi:hypothetical protein